MATAAGSSMRTALRTASLPHGSLLDYKTIPEASRAASPGTTLRIVAPIKHEPNANRPDIAKVDRRCAGRGHNTRRMWHVERGEQLKKHLRALIAGEGTVGPVLEDWQVEHRRSVLHHPGGPACSARCEHAIITCNPVKGDA